MAGSLGKKARQHSSSAQAWKKVKRTKVGRRARQNGAAQPAGSSQTTIDALPETALQNILLHLGFPHRFTAAKGTSPYGKL